MSARNSSPAEMAEVGVPVVSSATSVTRSAGAVAASSGDDDDGGRRRWSWSWAWLCTPLGRSLATGRLPDFIVTRTPCHWVCLLSLVLMAVVGSAALSAYVGAGLLGLTVFILCLRYLWWRLVWQPFGRLDDEERRGWNFCAETRDLCCRCGPRQRPRSQLYVGASISFWGLLILSLLGFVFANTLGHQTADPRLIVSVGYNAGGASLLLAVAVWAVDAAELAVEAALTCLYFCCISERNWTWTCLSSSATVPRNSQTNNNDAITEEEQSYNTDQEPDTDQDNSITSSITWTKLLISRLSTATSLCALVVMLGFSTNNCYSDPRIIEFDLPLRKLPPCADGFKLAVVTDVHVGAMAGPKEVRRLTELVLERNPDAVALVGDLADERVNAVMHDKLAPLADMKTTVPHGVYWTPGNHENIAGIQDFRDIFTTSDRSTSTALNFITTLENSYTTVNYTKTNDFGTLQQCPFDIAGLADNSGEEGGRRSTTDGQIPPDIDKTLAGRNATNALVLLNHQPVHFDKYARAGTGLMLSGHTHGGQIWPNHAVLMFIYGNYIAGLFSSHAADSSVPNAENDAAWLYVSEGALNWGPRVRLLAYPEITFITLRHPATFRAQGGSTSSAERLRLAVLGQYAALIALPVSVIVCVLRSYGCCRWQSKAAQAAFELFGVESEHMHSV